MNIKSLTGVENRTGGCSKNLEGIVQEFRKEGMVNFMTVICGLE